MPDGDNGADGTPRRRPQHAPHSSPSAPAGPDALGDRGPSQGDRGPLGRPRSFDELLAEASAVSVDGWDFSWLDGRATEERPPWGYAGLVAERMARARAALDIDTGGGEVLAGVPRLPALTAATESWPPNVARATARLHPRGAVVVATREGEALPFADAAFDLVVSRHPVRARWDEIARVLEPGGTYLSQEVGPASVFELVEYFLGPRPAEARGTRDPAAARAAAEAAGLVVTDVRTADLRTEFFDVGAVVYFLRKVIWMVPGFTVGAYRERLAELHADIARRGPFTATTTRFLIEARKPDGGKPDGA
ncbi:class I SAM-dependent methyltransferase [Streptomyces fuscigenes]|uniref:class I SAM-dependent methyltransferase n=1 Tax=Streptomyces fuscigenes TaxID=1528880 RepID=UPI0035570BC0